MVDAASPREIARLLAEKGLSPLKKFGQNFLIDKNIVNKIAAAAVCEGGFVLEIGAGLGALTTALSDIAQKVAAVEIDRGLYAALTETLAGRGNVILIEGDILKTEIGGISKKYFNCEAFSVCGNLPYYITSKILIGVLESGAPISSFTFMVQKEVARRLSADAGDADYGALTASCRYYGKPELLFKVSKNCFYPAPDVDSAVVRMNLSGKRPDVSRENYVKTVRAAFAMRRKTIYNNLIKIAGKETLAAALAGSCIAENARAQDVSPEKFALLARKLFEE